MILPGAREIVSYHIVAEGPCWGAVDGEEPVRLETGDILLIPHGDAYCISSEPRPVATEEDPEAIEFFRRMAAGEMPPVVVGGGSGPERNRIVCGFLGCERHPFNPLLDTLPRLIRMPAPGDGPDPLTSLIELALMESKRGQHGERCMLMRLSEVMFIEVLRRYLHTVPADGTGWLVALRDPLVGRALNLLHQRPAFPWTRATQSLRLSSRSLNASRRCSQRPGPPPSVS
jgi:hypothetical protein